MTAARVHYPSRAIPVRFVVWPARTLLVSQFLVLAQDRFPGLPEWIQRTREAMSLGLLEDLLLLNALAVAQKIVDEQLLAGLMEQDVPGFLEWVAEYDAERLSKLAKVVEIDTVRTGNKTALRSVSLGLQDSAAEWDGLPLSDEVWDRLTALRSDAEALHTLLISALSRFWAKHLRPAFDSQAHALRESAEHGRRLLSHPQSFEDLIEGLVGRRRPADDGTSEEIAEMLAVPVLHLGPYARSSQVDLDQPVFVVEFEAQRFLDRAQLPRGGLHASAFRTLGDESRLRIVRFLQTGEHYGGEIVEHVGLSQATVSGHLRLLVAEGIVSVRREGNTKYYSLNPAFFSQLERSIADLKATI